MGGGGACYWDKNCSTRARAKESSIMACKASRVNCTTDIEVESSESLIEASPLSCVVFPTERGFKSKLPMGGSY